MTREQIINNYFINVSPEKEHIDIYYVRKSILNALEANLQKFNGVLLDVGCGIMPYRELILNRNKKVVSYIGLDYENALDEEYALGKPDLFWKGDVIPMEDNAADTILATELFEHCPEPERVMKEMLRVLRPGGILFFTVPFLWNLHLVPYDEYRYTPFSLKRHLQASGFVNIEMAALGGLDASLAQMMAIWYKNRSMRPSYKSYLGKIILPAIKYLIKKEQRADKRALFTEGSMITGITGVAFKNKNPN